jgi:hypothetical protein
MQYVVEVRTAGDLEALRSLDRDHPLRVPPMEQWLPGDAFAAG